MVTAIKTHERIKIPVVDYEYKSAKKMDGDQTML